MYNIGRRIYHQWFDYQLRRDGEIIFNKILYICIANKIHHAKNKKRGN